MKIGYKRASDLFFCIIFLACLSVSAFGQNMFRKVNDFDGDGKADFAVTRDVNGQRIWYMLQSSNGFKAVQFGINNDQNTSGDYDGDGKIDIAVFRIEPIGNGNNGTFWILGSQTGVRSYQHYLQNYPNVVPAHQDYDGDGKTDFAHTGANHSIVFVLFSGGSGSINIGTSGGDLVRIGDMNGNNFVEAVGQTYNSASGTYVTRYSNSVSEPVRDVSFGIPGDQFVPADFDGDGKGDLAVFRQSDGMWWWIRSTDNSMQAAQFGQNGDKPVPADYDGDGKTDIAIWRPGEMQSYYWVYTSQGNVFAFPFGIGTDKVVTY